MVHLRQFLELIRFSHTIFALPFALLAAEMAWFADGGWIVAGPRGVLGIVLCMAFARSAAMSFNRLADRKLDAANPRTHHRHVPAGILTVPSVVAFTVFVSVGFLASTWLFWPNPWPPILALPVLSVVMAYSYAKRFTTLAHFWLGGSLMLAPLCTWLAVRGEVAWPPVVLGVGVLAWVGGFDIIYACQDVDFDRRAGLYSVPARVGIAGALRIAAACHLISIIALAILPVVFPKLGGIYLAGIAAVALLLVYEHWLVRPDDLGRVGQAFFQVNAVISLGLLLIGTLDLAL